MEFQFDPVGLSEVARRVATPTALDASRASSPPRGRRWSQALGRWKKWLGWPSVRDGRFRRLCGQLRQAVEEGSKPLLVYLVPFDIGKLRSGGGKRIAGIARALGDQFGVFVFTPISEHSPCMLQEMAPGCYLVGIPRSKEFVAQCRQPVLVRGRGIFMFAEKFEHFAEFNEALCLVGQAASAWGGASPVAWPVIRRHCRPGCPVFYDAHDDYAGYLQSSFACEDAGLIQRMVDMEAEALEHALVAAFCTGGDLAAARSRVPSCGEKMVHVPNGVDVAACRWVPPGRARELRRAAGLERPVALFVGAHHKPNLEAMGWIVSELAPGNPKAVFVVAGVHLEAYRKQGGAEPGGNVVFAGPVDEETKAALFAMADVALAPMKSGTGSSLKIPEYVAHGKVVVGTPMGLRGFGELRGFGSVVESEDVNGVLGEVLGRLEREPGAYDGACLEARRWVEEHLDWAVAVRPLKEALVAAGRSD